MRATTAVSGLACLLMSVAAQARDINTEVVNPRNFGYVIGDTFDRQIIVQGPPNLLIDEKSLPRMGRQNVWLNLISADIQSQRHADVHDFLVRLRYQVRNVPTHTRNILVPPLDLRLSDGLHATHILIDSLPVTLSPLLPTDLVAEAAPLRPDRTPQLIQLSEPVLRILIYAILAAAILAYPVLSPRILHRRGPFTQTYRLIRRAAVARDARTYRLALQALHRAFNESAGRRVFADQVDAFIAEKPHFADLRDSTAKFLQISQREFYAHGTPEAQQEWDWLLDFCRDCRSRERRGA